MSFLDSLIRREQGQALVEFALVVPILLVILLGTVDLGKAFNYWNDGTQLSAEGARYAAVNRKPDPTNPASLQEQIRLQGNTAELRNGGTADVTLPSQVCIDFPNGTTGIGDPVRVTMRFSFNWLPLLSVGANTALSSSSVMRLESLPTTYSAGCA